MLLDAGADVDLRNTYGATPLYLALFNVRDTQGDIVRCLLEAGADPNLQNNSGVSPGSLAGLVGNYIRKLLEPATDEEVGATLRALFSRAYA
jgi:ankyrin repeat protein